MRMLRRQDSVTADQPPNSTDVVAPAVHTTGVNWESVAVIAGFVTTLVTLLFGIFARLVANQITNAINKLRIDVIRQIELRLTEVETVLKNNRRR